MSKRLKTVLLAGLFAAFLSAAGSATARADFMVKIDCAAGQPDWGGSRDWVHVSAKINNAWVEVGSYISGLPNCTGDWSMGLSTGPWNVNDVQALRIYTNGTDTFWIDRIALADNNQNIVETWGDNDFIGFCFSKDSSDGRNAWCWNNRAYSGITFNR